GALQRVEPLAVAGDGVARGVEAAAHAEHTRVRDPVGVHRAADARLRLLGRAERVGVPHASEVLQAGHETSYRGVSLVNRAYKKKRPRAPRGRPRSDLDGQPALPV